MLNDEIIGAYLDGELTPERRAEVESALATNKGAALRLERMRTSDAALREAIGANAGVRENDPLAALIVSDWLQAADKRPARLDRVWGRRAAALAAACLIGLIAGRTTAPSAPAAPALSVSRELTAVLDRTPSGDRVQVSGGEVQPALTFRAGGTVCRQFRSEQGGTRADAVACRNGEAWRIVVQAALAERTSFQPASAGADPISAALEALGGVSVLDAREERELIAARWATVG